MENATGDFNLELHQLAVGEVPVVYFGVKAGGSPKDTRVVKHPDSERNVWWRSVNGGAYGTGKRISLKHTLATIDTIHDDVRRAAHQIIAGQGATDYGIGSAVTRIVEVLLHDQRAILTISSRITARRTATA